MFSKKAAIIAAIAIAVCGISVAVLKIPSEKILYEVDFGENDFVDTDYLISADGTLYLDTGEPLNTGGGEWSTDVTLEPARITWKWSGEDLGDYQLWLKVTFTDHKSIYYVAGGSTNPESEGEYYRDEEDRRRFAPSVVISGLPLDVVRRDIREDYLKYCGSFDEVEIERISVGMTDESQQHQNILRVSGIEVHT